MKKIEARKLLREAPADDMLSAVNPALTRRQAVKIVRDGLNNFADDDVLPPILEKRVWQVVKNKKNPGR